MACVACAALVVPSAALAITRDSVIARAQLWVNDPVPYSQSKYHDGYRTDCSGYASMVWQTDGFSWSTSTMHSVSHPITKEELKPGDVMLKAGSHVRVFYDWADDAHTTYVAYEQTTPNTKSSIKGFDADIADGYKPYRYNKITDSPSPWNITRNPSFDVWSSGTPVWWTFGSVGPGTSWQVRKDLVSTGTFALGLVNPNSTPDTYAEAYHASVVEPGKTYTLSAWAGTTTSAAAVRMRLIVYNAAGVPIGHTTTTGNVWGIGPGPLKPMSLSMVMPPGASRAVVGLCLLESISGSGVAGGTAVLDDVAFYVTSPRPIYRFYNSKNGTHFYTATGPERDVVANTLASTYAYEGIAYGVVASAANADPLYRFYNRKNGSHFYTASTIERDRVKSELSATYNYEGPAYNVCVSSVEGATPVYRFFNKKTGSHFYTISEVERADVSSRLTATYNYEGPAFYLAP